MRTLFLLCVAAVAAGCLPPGPGEKLPDGGAVIPDGGAVIPDGGTRPDAGLPPEGDGGEPLVEAPPRLERTCVESRAMLDLPTGLTNSGNAGLAIIPGEGAKPFHLALSQLKYVSSQQLFSTLFSTLSTAGVATGEAKVSETVVATYQEYSAPSMVGSGGRYSIVFGNPLSSAVVDADGRLLAGPTPIPAASNPAAAKLLRTGAGSAVLWIAKPSQEVRRIYLQKLDSDAKPVGSAVLVAQSTGVGYRMAFSAVKISSGFAVAFTRHNGASDGNHEIFFTLLDEDGQKVGAEKRVSAVAKAGAYFAEPDLIALPSGGFLAAWVDGYHDFGTIPGLDEVGYSVIRVARLDAAGERVGEERLVQKRELHVAQVRPKWVEADDRVALTWGRGKIIYVCAGCMPDDTLHFLLLDPQDFKPVSALVKHVARSGLTGQAIARNGKDFVTVANVTFHVNSVPASATIHCE